MFLTHGAGLSSGGSGCEGCEPPSHNHAQRGSFERGGASLRLATMPSAGVSSGGCEGCEPPSRDHAQCGSFEQRV